MDTAPYSPATREVLDRARSEAIALDHEYIGTEHLLLALSKEPDVVERVGKLGVAPADIRSMTERTVRRGKAAPTEKVLPFTSRSQNVLALAIEEAEAAGTGEVVPEHLLHGLLRENRGIAAEILHQLGVRLEDIR